MSLTLLAGLAGCNWSSDSKSSSSGNPGDAGGYQGTWLGAEILEFRQTKDPKIICDNIENDKYTGFKDELRIDGYVIDGSGGVFDFRLEAFTPSPMWKVRADGSTYDNVMVGLDSEGTEVLGLKMEKIDADRLAAHWSFKNNDGSYGEGHVEYVRMTDAEIQEIRKIAAACP